MKPANTSDSELKNAILALKPSFKRAIFFSVFTNLLVIMPMIYMLEVYDRVVTSGSGMTLAMETVAIVGILIVMEMLEWVRTSILHRAGLQFDKATGERTFNAVFEANLKRLPGISSQALHDLRNVREFISSRGRLRHISTSRGATLRSASFSPRMLSRFAPNSTSTSRRTTTCTPSQGPLARSSIRLLTNLSLPPSPSERLARHSQSVASRFAGARTSLRRSPVVS